MEHSTEQQYNKFSFTRAFEAFPKIQHILGHKTNFDKFRITEKHEVHTWIITKLNYKYK